MARLLELTGWGEALGVHASVAATAASAPLSVLLTLGLDFLNNGSVAGTASLRRDRSQLPVARCPGDACRFARRFCDLLQSPTRADRSGP